MQAGATQSNDLPLNDAFWQIIWQIRPRRITPKPATSQSFRRLHWIEHLPSKSKTQFLSRFHPTFSHYQKAVSDLTNIANFITRDFFPKPDRVVPFSLNFCRVV
jgi:hypothetical protein